MNYEQTVANTPGVKQMTKATKIGWIICTLGALFYCYEYLLRIAPAAMVTPLMQHFQLDATSFSALVALYYLAYTPMQAFVGLAHDLYGPRRVLFFAVILCAIGSLMFGMADSVAVASAGRILLGVGSAFAFVGALKLASVWLPSNRFAMFAGMITSLGMLGGMFGNIFMSVFVEHTGWRQTYYIGAISGVVLAIVLWLVIRDGAVNKQSQTAKPAASLRYIDVLKGLVHVIKNKQIWVAGAIGSLLYLSLSVFAELWGNKFAEQVYGFSMVNAASVNSMVFVGWLIGSPLIGFISDRFKNRRVPLIISSLLAAVFSLLAIVIPHPSIMLVGGLLLFFGICCSAENTCFALGRENARPELAGIAVAFVNLIVMFGGLVFEPLVGKFLDLFWDGTLENGVRSYAAHDYRLALLILPIGCVISALISLFWVRETHAELQHETALNSTPNGK